MCPLTGPVKELEGLPSTTNAFSWTPRVSLASTVRFITLKKIAAPGSGCTVGSAEGRESARNGRRIRITRSGPACVPPAARPSAPPLPSGSPSPPTPTRARARADERRPSPPKVRVALSALLPLFLLTFTDAVTMEEDHHDYAFKVRTGGGPLFEVASAHRR